LLIDYDFEVCIVVVWVFGEVGDFVFVVFLFAVVSGLCSVLLCIVVCSLVWLGLGVVLVLVEVMILVEVFVCVVVVEILGFGGVVIVVGVLLSYVVCDFDDDVCICCVWVFGWIGVLFVLLVLW